MSHHYSALTDFSLKLLYIHVKMHFEEVFFFKSLDIYIFPPPCKPFSFHMICMILFSYDLAD